ncbi:helix-turn-helix transcriptional regulator [Rhodovulum sp. DZ06]|uniref:helix-turn-helix transcriptional regulator n=1 Tax=Rhodovulum sp. DZ06 TaxID=3425126 RepID=UPI003D356AE5
MRRADRLFRLVQILRSGRLTTARKLAETLEVSERTVYRDVADLVGSGVPIEGEAGVGYVMRAGYDMPPLMFTADEAAALVAGARLLQAWGGAAMGAAAEDAIAKIDSVLPETARARARAVQVHALSGGGMPAEVRDRLDALEAAAQAHVRLTLAYRDGQGRETDRPVRPLGLWFWGKVWTMVAWCELRSDFRVFRVDRIAGMTRGEPFTPEKGKDLAAFYATLPADGPDGPPPGRG